MIKPNCLFVVVCKQQGVSGRISARMSAIENTHNEFRQQLSEVLHSSQKNQVVLNNLSTMFSIMMEKMGNPVTACETLSPTTQNTNSQMPSLDRMLHSGAGSAGDPPVNPKRLKVNPIEEASDVAKLKGKSVMQEDGNQQGGATEDVSLGGILVVAPKADETPDAPGNGDGGEKSCVEGEKGESKVDAVADGHVVEAEGGEGNNGRSGGGVDRSICNSDANQALPLSPLKGVRAKTRRKKKQKSATNVETSASQGTLPDDQVSTELEVIGTNSATKLLIFNIHGTLVDCSLLSESNPNSNIRITRKSLTRRIVFRPWLTEFLDMCFSKFKVVFWGIKSLRNMEEVVAEMMRRFEGMESHKPLFCWSAKECEDVSHNSGKPKWKKPLSKVWTTWPLWNESNTMIIDHIGALVDCNPIANIIIPPAFYVEDLKKLADDKNYLRLNLWPLLDSLAGSPNVQQFRGVIPATEAGVKDVTTSHAAGRTTRSSTLKQPNSEMSGHPKLSGEGTCELLVHIGECPLTYVSLSLTRRGIRVCVQIILGMERRTRKVRAAENTVVEGPSVQRVSY